MCIEKKIVENAKLNLKWKQNKDNNRALQTSAVRVVQKEF